MAPKRPSPLDEPPNASSSSSSEEEEAAAASSEPRPSSVAPPPHNKHPSKMPPLSLNPASSQSGSGSDSGSDSEHRWVANPRVKPIATKPMEDTRKAKNPPPSPPRSNTKRRTTDNNVNRQPSASASKRAKKNVFQLPVKEDDGKVKKGKDPPHSSKPQAKKTLELSRIEGIEKAKSNGKARGDQKESGRTVASLKTEQLNSKEFDKKDIHQPNGSMLSLSEMLRFDESLGLPTGLGEDVIKSGLELIGASKRAELEKRWRNLQAAELELYVKCAELISDQAKLICEAYKSSHH